jgi:NMD protein affecting ribosome stability and mRNA decay
MAFCVECGNNVGEATFCSNCGAKQKELTSIEEVSAKTEFPIVCEILGKFWLDVKGEAAWAEFIRYNDLGLPLAYALTQGIVEATDSTEGFVNETWLGLLKELDAVDQGFTSFEQFEAIIL